MAGVHGRGSAEGCPGSEIVHNQASLCPWQGKRLSTSMGGSALCARPVLGLAGTLFLSPLKMGTGDRVSGHQARCPGVHGGAAAPPGGSERAMEGLRREHLVAGEEGPARAVGAQGVHGAHCAPCSSAALGWRRSASQSPRP